MSQSITIAFIDASKQRQLYTASPDKTISIGNKSLSTIQQLHPYVDDRHCQVRFSTSYKRWIVEDQASNKGTYLNGDRVTKARVLSNNDRIRLGSDGPILSVGLQLESVSIPGPVAHQKAASNPPPVSSSQRAAKESSIIPIILILFFAIGGVAVYALFRSQPVVVEQKKPADPPLKSKPVKTICSESSFDASELYNLVKGSVVLIETPSGSGSGVVISSSDGVAQVLTNAHVVEGHQEVTLHYLNNPSSTGTVVKVGRQDQLSDDLAVLNTSLDGLSVAKFSPLLSIGDNVFVIGSPSLGEGTDVVSGWSLTKGIISNIDPAGEKGVFQTDAGINPGNSGGPIFNSKGCVVGLAVAVPSDRTVQQVGFAISAEAINQFLAK